LVFEQQRQRSNYRIPRRKISTSFCLVIFHPPHTHLQGTYLNGYQWSNQHGFPSSVGCPFRGIVDVDGIRTRDWMETCRIGTYLRATDMGCTRKLSVAGSLHFLLAIHSQNEYFILFSKCQTHMLFFKEFQ